MEDLDFKLKIIFTSRTKRTSWLATVTGNSNSTSSTSATNSTTGNSNTSAAMENSSSSLLQYYSHKPMEAVRILLPVFPALCIHLNRVAKEYLSEEDPNQGIYDIISLSFSFIPYFY